ncbi:lytic transglycosylase domain-containing protein [Leptobacterium sp. I13]|uniref:lytic transglycosylase domain-containing protein n=1 Tax=Leptobacterium meishanense TaxID=3128904 RepID=UPI0030EB39DE
MKPQIITFFFLFSTISIAQKSADTITGIKKDSLTLTTSVLLKDSKTGKYEAAKGILKNEPSEIELKDNIYAAKIDSLWMQELYGSDLFTTVHSDVTNLTYEEVEYEELHTDTLKARLARINERTPFNIEYNPSLESVIKNFLKNRRESLQGLMDKSEYYFPMFEKELDNYDVPLEVKYLALIESALDPRARSRVGATGLWQFMFSTGKMYGLEVSSYVDDRMDPLKSTIAASKYLAKLYDIFDDWDLALAAYNSGPGNVSKAIRRSGGYQNYWNLRPFLPRETAGYVPAFLATMYIFEYAEEHGFKRNQRPIAYFETDTIHVKKLITFDHITSIMGVPKEEIQFFNPSYKIDIIPYIQKETHTLRLRKDIIGKFVANEDSIYAYVEADIAKREKPLPQLVKVDSKIRYRVKTGDYLGKIANKYGVRVSDIKKWNGMRSNNIRVGQRLTIFPRKLTKNAVDDIVPDTKKVTQSIENKTYIVKSGDSLWLIAKKFPGISVQNLKEWNDIRGNNLKPGMKLKLCSC